jgi:hypothetical protein
MTEVSDKVMEAVHTLIGAPRTAEQNEGDTLASKHQKRQDATVPRPHARPTHPSDRQT